MSKCIFCGNVASLYCDKVLGWAPKLGNGNEYIDISRPYICDAPICGGCTKQVGRINIRGEFDSIDHCPICVKQSDKLSHLIFRSKEQSEVFRRAHHAKRLSAKNRHLRSIQGGGQICLL